MGKALVISGLEVTNPLTVVTFDLPVTGITLDKNSLSVDAGDSAEVVATVATSDGSIIYPVFSISDSTKATISSVGNTAVIDTIKSGTVTLTAKAGSYTATCSIVINKTAEEVLADYYLANTGLSSSEKTALDTFVSSMITNGLWDKVEFFYPMLGDTPAKMAIEVIDDSTALPKYTYGKDNNFLIGHPASESRSAKQLTGRKFKSTSCFVGSGKCSTSSNGYLVDSYTTETTPRNVTAQLVVGSAYKCPRFAVSDIGTTDLKDYTGSHDERIFGYLTNSDMSSIKLYHKNSLFDSKQVSGTPVEEYTLQRVFGVFSDENVRYSSFVIFTSLSEAEYAIYEGLLETFLIATGKLNA